MRGTRKRYETIGGLGTWKGLEDAIQDQVDEPHQESNDNLLRRTGADHHDHACNVEIKAPETLGTSSKDEIEGGGGRVQGAQLHR